MKSPNRFSDQSPIPLAFRRFPGLPIRHIGRRNKRFIKPNLIIAQKLIHYELGAPYSNTTPRHKARGPAELQSVAAAGAVDVEQVAGDEKIVE